MGSRERNRRYACTLDGHYGLTVEKGRKKKEKSPKRGYGTEKHSRAAGHRR